MNVSVVAAVCRVLKTATTFAPHRPAATAKAIGLELTELEGLVPVPGAETLLAVLTTLGPDRVAVVTSATRALAAVRMEAAGLPVPPVLVGADEVAKGKPDSEGYRLSARRLGIDPARCLVVEDAPAGLEAGRAAGARVLAVATTLPPRALAAWDWVPDLTALAVRVRTSALDAGDTPPLQVTVA
jgi:sugar-phosphatase